LASTDLPEWSSVTREIDGGETPLFKENFYLFDPPRSLSTAAQVVRAVWCLFVAPVWFVTRLHCVHSDFGLSALPPPPPPRH